MWGVQHGGPSQQEFTALKRLCLLQGGGFVGMRCLPKATICCPNFPSVACCLRLGLGTFPGTGRLDRPREASFFGLPALPACSRERVVCTKRSEAHANRNPKCSITVPRHLALIMGRSYSNRTGIAAPSLAFHGREGGFQVVGPHKHCDVRGLALNDLANTLLDVLGALPQETIGQEMASYRS